MPTSTIVIKNLVETYQSIQFLKKEMDVKLNYLIESQPFYRIFEVEQQLHPYYELVKEIQVIETNFSHLFAALLGWSVGGITLAQELKKLEANLKPPSLSLAALSAIPAVSTSIADCAVLLREIVSSIALFRSHVSNAWIKDKVRKNMDLKSINGHIEVPLYSMTKQSNDAYKKIKDLSKLIIDIDQNQTTLRDQLLLKKSMTALAATGNMSTSDSVIALLLSF
jgi:hypothetical protein